MPSPTPLPTTAAGARLRRLRFTRAVLLVLALAIGATAAFASSPYSWATYYAPKRTFPIAIDGDLSDWSSVKGFTMNQEKFFFVGQGISSAKWGGPRDLSATFKLAWDDQYLYVAVEVTDDRVTEPHGSLVPGMETGSWDDDGIELMFDDDGSNSSHYYVGDLLHHEFHFVYSATHPFVFDNFWKYKEGAPQPMFDLPDGSKEPLAFPNEVMSKNDITSTFATGPYHGAYAFKRTPQGYNFELRILLPGAVMRPIHDGGRAIGFDLAINDNDEGKGSLKQELHWSGMNDMFWRDTKYFGTLILVDTGAPVKP